MRDTELAPKIDFWGLVSKDGVFDHIFLVVSRFHPRIFVHLLSLGRR